LGGESCSVRLEWKPPVDDGGSAILKYGLEKYEGGSWVRVAEVGSELNSFLVTGLDEGVEYTFRVSAENKIGKSEHLTSDGFKATKERVVVVPPPRAPFEILGMTQTSFTLRWVESEVTETKVKGYIVEKREAGKKAWMKSAFTEVNFADVTGLKANFGYHFRICAVDETEQFHSVYVLVREELITIGKIISGCSLHINAIL
jgi:titin